MLFKNASTVVPAMLMAALPIPLGDNQHSSLSEDMLMQVVHDELYSKTTSGEPITSCDYSTNIFSRTYSTSNPIDISSIKRKLRYQAIVQSFQKYKSSFPEGKDDYIRVLADAVCKLHFNDNVSSYNRYTETIDTTLNLSGGLTLSISQFLSEEADAAVVFSIHRGQALLVSDEMPINDIVNTINAIYTES